ncbi:hypothetical protein [Halobacterium hubeiense]|uniref:hypothetical protein n=1 Tax=Halobacterium hubeiense TaxID=1407499 RepID=UPI003C71B010
MSTHTRRTTDPTPSSETEPTATATEPTPVADDAAEPSDTAASWVARCQSQFDAGGRDRLNNLADDENHAMPDGV